MAEFVVTFEPGTSPELAQVDVQNRLKKAEARMPQAALTQGLQVEQTSAGFLMIYALNYKDSSASRSTVELAIMQCVTSITRYVVFQVWASCSSSALKRQCGYGFSAEAGWLRTLDR